DFMRNTRFRGRPQTIRPVNTTDEVVVAVQEAVDAGHRIADLDLADPQWNTSGVSWHELYHRHNYPRLQKVKAAWDPLNLFHHDFSVRPEPPSVGQFVAVSPWPRPR